MPVAIRQIELEGSVDENVARLEANTDHIQADITDIKADVRELTADMCRIEGKLESKVDALKDAVAAMRLEMKEGLAAVKQAQVAERVWWLLISAAILSVLARAMKWI